MLLIQFVSANQLILIFNFLLIGSKPLYLLWDNLGWALQIWWYIECSTLTTLFFRIWNHLPGIPSPPLTLFIIMLSKAQLTSNCRMSGSRCMATPLWLSRSLRPFFFFFFNSSVYSCHLFLISYASVRSILFLSLILPIFAWNVPLVSLIFLKEISSLSHSVFSLYFFVLFTKEGFLISPSYTLELCIQLGICPLLLCLSLLSYL